MFKAYQDIDISITPIISVLLEDIGSNIEGYRCIGNGNNFNITLTGVPLINMQIFILWEANASGIVSIFNTIMPSKFNYQKVLITSTFNGSEWKTHFDVDSKATGLIDNANISSNAAIERSKIANGIADHVIINDNSGNLSSQAQLSNTKGGTGKDMSADSGIVKISSGTFSASKITNSDIDNNANIDYSKLNTLNNGQLVVGNAGVPTVVTMAGDLNISNTGNTTISNNAITTSKIADNAVNTSKLDSTLQSLISAISLYSFDVTIPAEQVLTLNTSPITLVNAQGANTIIVPISIVGELIFNTTPYATRGEIDIFNGGNRQVFTLPPDDGFLFANGNRIVEAVSALNQTITDNQYVKNSPLTITVGGGNPTAGDSDIRLIGLYKIITL